VNMTGTFPALVDIVRRLAGQGQFAAALQEIEHALPQLPSEQDKLRLLQFDIARAAQDERYTAQALQALAQMMREQPQSAPRILASLRLRNEHAAAWPMLASLVPDEAYAPEALLLGVEFTQRGEFGLAQAAYRYALACKQNFFEAHLNLGDLLLRERDFSGAQPHFEAALQIDAANANAWLGLGQCLLNIGKGAQALQAFEHLSPQMLASPLVSAWSASAMAQGNDEDAAIALYEQALAGDARCFPALFGSALIHERRGNLEEAANRYERAFAADPTSKWALSNLVYCLRCMADWPRMLAPEAELLRRLRSGDVVDYGSSSWVSLDLPGPILREIAADFTRTQSRLRVGEPRQREFRPHQDERLRIAYVSSDFRDHATSRLLVEVLEHHDRERFEVYLYALQANDGSPLGKRVAAACAHFIDVSGLAAEQVAERLLADRIDLLIDLHGHTKGECAGLVALRPAPIVVSYLGYPGTMGDYVDYIIGDEFVTPHGAEGEFSEAIVRLPGSYQPNDRNRIVGPPMTRAECGLPSNAIIACSFNQVWKITPQIWAVWMELMRRHPRLELWLLDENPWVTRNLRDEAGRADVAAERIVFAARMPQAQHLARIALADIAFDTAPCNSHTTGADALWMGVPFVSMLGDSFKARVGASLLHAVGLPELVVPGMPEYADKLDALIGTPERLAAIKAGLLQRRQTASLFDAPGTARALEGAYTAMYERFRAGEAPAAIDLITPQAAS
jgi:protein O-GlcNAc transferase